MNYCGCCRTFDVMIPDYPERTTYSLPQPKKDCNSVDSILNGSDPVTKAWSCALEKFNEITAEWNKEESRLDTEYADAEKEVDKVADELASMFSVKVSNNNRNGCRRCNWRRRRRR